MTTMPDFTELEFARADLVYHQARVLLLVAAVAAAPGHSGKLDGMTKLAKLDFLVRYPGLGSIVLDRLDPEDPRLHLAPTDRDRPTAVEAPMIRYKYGPWDHRYYAVIGALVGRGLVQYRQGRRGSVAVAPTPAGRRAATELRQRPEWLATSDRSVAIAEASGGLGGTALKDLIYARLPGLLARPLREVIR